MGGYHLNLRQKVKHAKKELAIIDEKYPARSTWGILEKVKRQGVLLKIIDHKRKRSKYVSEKPQIDLNKLTYLSLHADFHTLLTIKSVNGKPLTERQIVKFLDDCRIKISIYGKTVQQKESDDRRHTDYCFIMSNDRTKRKTLFVEYIYYQYHGDDKLHPYNNNEVDAVEDNIS